MSDIAIRVDNLGKTYRLAHKRPHDSLKEAITAQFRGWGRRRSADTDSTADETFWALRDVSFEVKKGEVLGVIGRNGAGKSTLLKILSRITDMTTGTIDIYGRIGSLLEVGTGFHPELTGRENIFLNGAIMGMSQAEVRRKFDEIVAFSEVEKFLDTQVKHYSSGMYTRLAFAVAAHLEPEILVIDEVLAVGDVAFQRKCLGKMDAVAKAGRTILFVSHNLQMLRGLCKRGILLEDGRIALDAPIQEAVDVYNESSRKAMTLSEVNLKNRLNRTSGKVRFTSFELHDSTGAERWNYHEGEPLRVVCRYRAFEQVPSLLFFLVICSGASGEKVTTITEMISPGSVLPGEGSFDLLLPRLQLRPGDYSFYACLGDQDRVRWHDVIDENADLRWLVVTSRQHDVHRDAGCVTLDYQMRVN